MNTQTATAGTFAGTAGQGSIRGWIVFAGIALVALGILAIVYDATATIVSVVLFGSLLLLAGVMQIVNALQAIASTILRFPSWGWTVLSGLVSVALGVMLAIQWPMSGTWFVGFAVGLDLMLYGWALLMFASAIKKLANVFA